MRLSSSPCERGRVVSVTVKRYNDLSWAELSLPLKKMLRQTNMQKYLMAVVLVISFVAQVMAAEVFYIILDTALNGCTVATT
jgi:hypothetical protein